MKKAQRAIVVSIGIALLSLGACRKAEAPAVATTPAAQTAPAVAAVEPSPPPTAEQLAQAAVENAQPLSADATTWTPEALEELAAPIALYPDPVLEQVLIASTNPQEVLDAGNWLLDNKSLKGKALDQAAEQQGFTPPMRALLPFPETVDMMAGQMGWTEELGQAYVNDQAGVMDAIQRLRQQAEDVGTLQSSPQMTVAAETVDDVRYITVSPPSPEVIYVPQYDPVTVYAPQPETTTTTVVQEGHSTGALVTTGLLAFGAGMLVNEIFDDDDNCNRNYYYNGCRGGNYYGGYWGVPRPYYPPYPYRPNYGNGFYPGYGYNRPGYGGGFNNNDININGDININSGNDYWNRFDKKPGNGNRPDYGNRRPEARSPISAANPKRKDLDQLNRAAAKGPKRPAPSKGPEFSSRDQYQKARPETRQTKKASAVQGTYKGAKPGANTDRVAAGKAAGAAASRDLPKVQGNYAGNKSGGYSGNSKKASRDLPKTQGDYAGNKAGGRDDMNKATARPNNPQARDQKRPNADRGYADNSSRPNQKPAARPEQRPEQKPQMKKQQRPEQRPEQKAQMKKQQRPEQRQQQARRPEQRPQQKQQKQRNAMSGSKQNGSQARAASQRGQQSRPQGSGGKRSGKRN
jgi:hypothetical protein